MKKRSASRSAFFNPRVLIGFVLCSVGVLLALAGWSKSVTDSLGNPVLKTGMVRHETTAETPGTWTATGSMNTARYLSTATPLNNGKILVTGGVDASGNATASAELYDPSTGTWTPTASMNTARNNLTATLLTNGKVLVAGGNGIPLSTAELYDPDTATWTLTGSMNAYRVAHLATLLPNGPLAGKVLVTGGLDENYVTESSAELYDPSTGLWTDTGSMTIARYWDRPSPTTLPDGSILIVGGTTCCPYHWFNEAELYDPVSQSWTPTSTKMTTANEETILLPDGRVLVAGGVSGTQPTAVNVATAELFDSSAGTWTATAEMSIDRVVHTLTLLASGQALVAGGASGGWGVCHDVSSAELYDSSAGKWLPTGDMTVPRYYHTATLLPNGQVLVAGGADCEGHILSSAELYTPPAVATLSTTSLTFGVQLVGTHSVAQTATLTNAGTTTLTISSIAASGDFLAKDNCGSSLPAGASCTINVAFSPSAKGVRTGSVTITDDAANSPQTIKLTGTGTIVQLSPSALDFGNQIVGTTSDPQTTTVTNIGSEDLHISGIARGGANFGDFAETTTCGSNLAAGGSCTIDITFTPSVKGHRHAKLLMFDDGGGSPQSVPLKGTGVLH
jgi:hypothetical protein